MVRGAVARDAPHLLPAREAELAARWAAGAWRGATLRTLSGATYRLIFEGRRNGGPGPDFRDAALETADGARLLGDIELHLRARDWMAHGHHVDTRYNRVVLHVALDAASNFSPLADGGETPIVCLNFTQAAPVSPSPGWPCADLSARIGPVALRSLLLWAANERFEAHARAFSEALARATSDMSQGCWSAADCVLWVALAEALGYGQHRDALRQAGIRLLTGDAFKLDDAGRSERIRLMGLLALWERWRSTGPWQPLHAALMSGPTAVIMVLRVSRGAISTSRARIMAANVVLPFATALAAQIGDAALGDRGGIAPAQRISRYQGCHRTRSPAR